MDDYWLFFSDDQQRSLCTTLKHVKFSVDSSIEILIAEIPFHIIIYENDNMWGDIGNKYNRLPCPALDKTKYIVSSLTSLKHAVD